MKSNGRRVCFSLSRAFKFGLVGFGVLFGGAEWGRGRAVVAVTFLGFHRGVIGLVRGCFIGLVVLRQFWFSVQKLFRFGFLRLFFFDRGVFVSWCVACGVGCSGGSRMLKFGRDCGGAVVGWSGVVCGSGELSVVLRCCVGGGWVRRVDVCVWWSVGGAT